MEGPEGKMLLGGPRCGWEGNIKMHFKEIGWEDVDWINVAQDWDRYRAVVNTVMNF